MTPRLFLLSALALTACQTDASRSGSGGPASGGSSDALPDTATVQSVDPESSADLVARDVRAVSPSVAIQTIDLWVARLDTVSVEGASDVRGDLVTLRNLLQSSPLDGPAIGRVLGRLGEGTAGLAEPGSGLDRLAVGLRRQAARLAPDTTSVSAADSLLAE